MGGGGREKGAVTARGSATAAFARRWRPSCGGPWGRASGTTYSCPATSAAPTAKPRGFANQLWKQVDHLGNAGFDPVLFRVDTDAASPLAWDVHHWFPCARGGTTVQSNIRIMQLQASRKKHNKLEFLKLLKFLGVRVASTSVVRADDCDFGPLLNNFGSDWVITSQVEGLCNLIKLYANYSFEQFVRQVEEVGAINHVRIISSLKSLFPYFGAARSESHYEGSTLRDQLPASYCPRKAAHGSLLFDFSNNHSHRLRGVVKTRAFLSFQISHEISIIKEHEVRGAAVFSSFGIAESMDHRMEEGDAILDCRCLWRVAAIFLILALQRPQSIHGSELLPATPTHVENVNLAVQN